jgi:hypothetical protein
LGWLYILKERANQPVTVSSLDAAIKRGRKRRETQLRAKTVAYLAFAKSLMIGFGDDSAVLLPIKNYPELATLSNRRTALLPGARLRNGYRYGILPYTAYRCNYYWS